MRSVLICLSLLASACDVVLGLEARDAGPDVLGIDAPDQHDEDQDGHVDSVDNCPSIENPLQTANGDEAVGIVCDPNRNMPGDQIVRAASTYFESALEPFAGFTWMVSGDAAVTMGPVASTDTSLTTTLSASNRTSLTVAAIFKVRDLGVLGNDNRIAIEITVGTSAYLCTIHTDDPSSNSFGAFTGAVLTTGTFSTPALSLDVPHQLTVEIDPDSPSCDFDGGRATSTQGDDLGGDVTVVVRARRMLVEISSIMVYERP
ncbi:MAG: hypothetical protein H0T42_22980 [Deltaproteobacteria bacterium]|nr:hypothetical protein [Deltaproteobacteria bacterium]